MPNPKRKYTIEEARAFAKKNPEAYNKALDKINPDPYRGTKKFAELLINQYPDRFKGLKPENFLSMLDSIAKAESPEGNVIQKSYNKKTKKYYDGPARGYFQIETTSAPTFSNRYKAYQDILKPLSAVPLPDIKVPKSGDVRSLSRDEQARLALANMSTVAAVKKEKLNPFDSQNSWLNFHWNGSPADKPARQQHWKETFGYGDGGQIEPTRADSLALLNNSKSLEKYYSKYDLVNKNEAVVKADTTEQGYILPGFDAHDYNARNFKDFYSNNSAVRVPSKNGNAMNLPRNSLPKQQYRRDIDNNKYYQRESSDRILDTRAPMALFDKRIMPNVFNSYNNTAPNDPMNGDGVTIYGYDPLSITPFDMLTPKQQKQRVAQFGTNGTPYKSAKEYNASNPSGRPNPPVSKMDTINKKIPIDYNQQISTDSPVTVPQFQPYTASNNPNIARGYYDLGQGKKIETFKEGGRIKAKDGLIVNPGFDAGVQRKDNTQVIIPNQVQQNQEVFNARQDQQQTYLKPDTNIYSDKQKTEQRNYNKFDERRDAVGNTIKSLGIDPKLPFTDPKEFALQTALGALPIDKLGKIAKLDKLGKALGTSEGLLSNTYKVNPWAFKPNSNAYYRMIGQEGYKDALESGVIRPPQYHYITPQGMPKLGDHNIELIDGNLKQKLNFPKYEESYYNSQYPLDTRWFPDNFKNRKARISGYKGPYMAEINGNHNLFNSPEGIASYQGPDIKATITTSKKHIPINTPGTKFYKEHWLQGYKEVPKTNIKSTWSIIN